MPIKVIDIVLVSTKMIEYAMVQEGLHTSFSVIKLLKVYLYLNHAKSKQYSVFFGFLLVSHLSLSQ